MAVWFIDGFDHYSGGDAILKWTATSNTHTWSSAYTRQKVGQGMRIAGNGAYNIYKTRPGTAVDTFIIGFAFKYEWVQSNIEIFSFIDGTTEQCSVRQNGVGNLTFNRGTTALATSSNTFSIGAWYYLECKAKINSTTGTYEVRINGTSTGWIPAVTGANTRNGGNNQVTGIRLGWTTGNQGIQYDDLYVCDTTGSVNIDFLGPQVVETVRPMGAGNYSQWTPNLGLNFSNVNDLQTDNDGTFNQSSTAGQKDSFVMSDLSAGGTVSAIQHVLYAKQSVGAQRSIRPVQRSGGTDFAGATVNTGTSYTMALDLDDVNPATGAAFTPFEINAAEFGYELVS